MLTVIGVVFVVLLCMVGILLSSISLSGTWLVAGASLLAYFVRGEAFPGIWTVAAFLVLSVLVEVAEFFAAPLGVVKRGGSHLAGAASVVGGIIGLVLGTFIPVPILGNLIGMLVGSFGLVFIIERKRLQRSDKAADIAFGAVLSRIIMILLKVVVTLGMIGYLLIGMIVW